MTQTTRDKLIVLALLGVKLLTTTRTGIDTYLVSHDLLNVMLIDLAFLSLWLVAAYGGRGQNALALRPFAALGAWVLYAMMLIIGWEAHASGVAIAVRAAGAMVLAYDTYDYLVAVAQRMRIKRNADTIDAWKDRIEERIYRKAFKQAMFVTQRGEAQTAVNAIARERIAQWLRQPVSVGPNVMRSLPAGNAYVILESGHVECDACGWVSNRAYDSAFKAQTAYAAHTRSAMHQVASARQIINVE